MNITGNIRCDMAWVCSIMAGRIAALPLIVNTLMIIKLRKSRSAPHRTQSA